jgi:SWI/SNF-related matrix-associated actin-dependent regulator 1 of chromatin subfamily A
LSSRLFSHSEGHGLTCAVGDLREGQAVVGDGDFWARVPAALLLRQLGLPDELGDALVQELVEQGCRAAISEPLVLRSKKHQVPLLPDWLCCCRCCRHRRRRVSSCRVASRRGVVVLWFVRLMDSDDPDFKVPETPVKQRTSARPATSTIRPPMLEEDEPQWLTKEDAKKKKTKKTPLTRRQRRQRGGGDDDGGGGVVATQDEEEEAQKKRPKRKRKRRSSTLVDSNDDDDEEEDPDDSSAKFFTFLEGLKKVGMLRTKKKEEEEDEDEADAGQPRAPVPIVAKTAPLISGEQEEEDSEEAAAMAISKKRKRKLDDDDDDDGWEPAQQLSRPGTAVEISDDDDEEEGIDGTEIVMEERDEREEEEEEEEEADVQNKLDAILGMCEACSRRLCEFLESAATTAEPTPSTLTGRLRSYQLAGVNWVYLLYRLGMNGILADEMGLGKGVQTIALLALLQTKNDDGPHLIVVPATTLENWRRELESWCPSLAVLVYWGNQREREEMRASAPPQLMQSGTGEEPAFNIVLTTFTIASSKFDRSYLRKCGFNFFIVDEAQNIKNAASRRFEKLLTMPAKRRLLLTGTPLQNNLRELWALLRFLMPEIIDGGSKSSSSSSLQRQIFTGDEEVAVERLKKILSPFILRRLKSQVATDVIAKRREVIECQLGAEQRVLYEQLVDRSRTQWQKFGSESITPDCEILEASACGEDDVEVARVTGRRKSHATQQPSILNNIVMQLRKLANHPLLCRNHYSEETVSLIAREVARHSGDEVSGESRFRGASVSDLTAEFLLWSDFDLHSLCCRNEWLHAHRLVQEDLFGSGKLVKLRELLEQLRPQGKKVLVFSQMTRVLDILEVAASLEGWPFLRMDGNTPVPERQGIIDRFNTEPIFVFFLSTRAAGLGINLTAADTVIFYDISFNPHVDLQAEDRCHRLGQSKEVTIYRLIAKGTVDEYMLAMAKDKLTLHDRVLDEGDFSAEATEQSAEAAAVNPKHWILRMLSDMFSSMSPQKPKPKPKPK